MFKLATTSSVYVLIILPLVSSLMCFISRQKSVNYFIYLFSTAISLAIILSLGLKAVSFSKISNDFEISTISITQEFHLDIISLFFLLIISYVKLIINSLYYFNIEKHTSEELNQKTYAVLLLNIFAINSILLTNNIFNLFVFCEIYIFTFLAICSSSNDQRILKSVFNYFCLSSTSSLILLLAFITLYLCFGEASLNKIVDNFELVSEKNYWYLFLILFSISLAIFLKFFPLWIFYKNIKSNNNLCDIVVIEVFFVTCLIGLYLVLKFTNSFFGNNLLFVRFNYDILLIILSIVIISYSSFRAIKGKHLKHIAIDLSIKNLGFIFMALAIRNNNSIKAMLYFIINNIFTNLALLVMAIFVKRNFKTSSIEQIYFSQKISNLISFFLKIFIPFVVGLPFTFLFFANYYLCLSLFEYNYTLIGLILVVISNFAHFKLGLDLFRVLHYKDSQQYYHNIIIDKFDNKKIFQLAFILNLIFIGILIFNINFLEKFLTKFVQYFLL